MNLAFRNTNTIKPIYSELNDPVEPTLPSNKLAKLQECLYYLNHVIEYFKIVWFVKQRVSLTSGCIEWYVLYIFLLFCFFHKTSCNYIVCYSVSFWIILYHLYGLCQLLRTFNDLWNKKIGPLGIPREKYKNRFCIVD